MVGVGQLVAVFPSLFIRSGLSGTGIASSKTQAPLVTRRRVGGSGIRWWIPVLLLVWVVASADASPQQMSIRAYFKAPAAASAAGSVEEDVPGAVLGKRARGDDAALTDATGSSSPAAARSAHETPAKSAAGDAADQAASALTPEQLERIARNKQIALQRRKAAESKTSCASTPPAAKDVMEAALAMPTSWKDKLHGEFSKEYFKKLCNFHSAQVLAKKTIFPPTAQVFSAFYACDFEKVSVVIVGQDPYHGPGQAHGLCFSVQKGVAVPPSLRNMYKELSEDPAVVPKFKIPSHGCLTKWAQQGVLLLNACLSVESGKANSHQGQGWETFTDAVIAACNKSTSPLVFLLWGAPAAKKCQSVNQHKHVVLKAPHPSPLSAHRGFFGCRHFSKCNEQLARFGHPQIDWQIV